MRSETINLQKNCLRSSNNNILKVAQPDLVQYNKQFYQEDDLQFAYMKFMYKFVSNLNTSKYLSEEHIWNQLEEMINIEKSFAEVDFNIQSHWLQKFITLFFFNKLSLSEEQKRNNNAYLNTTISELSKKVPFVSIDYNLVCFELFYFTINFMRKV
jgi:hypothetical protein